MNIKSFADEISGGAVFSVDSASAFKEYSHMVYRLAFVRTGNRFDAEDILSDVFLRLVRSEGKIKSREHLKSWLIRATINCSNSLLTSAYRRHRADLEEFDGAYSENKISVLEYVLRLPKNHKTVIYMYYYEGYSVEEIAKFCSVSKGTVKSRLARARKNLEITLKEEFIDV